MEAARFLSSAKSLWNHPSGKDHMAELGLLSSTSAQKRKSVFKIFIIISNCKIYEGTSESFWENRIQKSVYGAGI